MFMRDVESLPLYIQMKGRGVRTIGDENCVMLLQMPLVKTVFIWLTQWV